MRKSIFTRKSAGTESLRAPGPSGLVDKYPGQWVALQSGEVVAVAPTRGELRDAKVDGEVAIYHVPTSPLSI